MVVPQALRVLRLKPGRKYCTVGRLGHEFGWKYQDVVARCVDIVIRTHCLLILYRLEERRKAKSAAYYERKKKTRQQIGQAAKATKVDKKTSKALEGYGY
jgi:large subunit ribosomal protein L13Ae